MYEKCMRWILKAEGGYVNDPSDRGGETNFGISKRSYPDLDIKNLTEDQAKGIYLKDFYNKFHCDKMLFDLSVSFFDCTVNQGPGTASKLMQEALNKCRLKIRVDGVIGSKTLMAINAANQDELFSNFMALRAVRYAQDYLVKYDYGQFKRLFDLTVFLGKN